MRVIRNLSVRIPWHNERPSACRRSYRARRYIRIVSARPATRGEREIYPMPEISPYAETREAQLAPEKLFS